MGAHRFDCAPYFVYSILPFKILAFIPKNFTRILPLYTMAKCTKQKLRI